MFEFAWPFALLLLPLPWIIERFVPPTQHKLNQALKIPFYHGIRKLLQKQTSGKKQRLRLWLLWLFLVLALSGPQWVGQPQPVKREGRNLILALDLSGSMQIRDMIIGQRPVSRLFVVKETARQFIKKREGDRLGLILFGSRAYLQTPLTFDKKTVLHMLNDATVGLAGQTTAIGDAIGLAVKRLEKTPAKSRVLILLTDGVNNAGVLSPLQAATIAKEHHIKIYTIGLGAEEMVVQSVFGPQVYNPSQDLNEDELKKIAQMTGGQFFRAKDFKALEKVYQTINTLEPVKAKSTVIRPVSDYYYWPLSLAFILFLSLGFGKLGALYTPKQSKGEAHG